MMHLYIPSRGRARMLGVEGTLSKIPEYFLADTTVVVPLSEQEEYRRCLQAYTVEGAKIALVDDKVRIAEKRQLIGLKAAEAKHEKFIVLDDDLVLAVRVQDDHTRLRQQAEDDTRKMLYEMERLLDQYAHVAISLRQGNNNVGTGPSPLLQECGRGIRLVGYRTEEFNRVEHCRVPVMEDIDVTLQLLRLGMPNAILFWWAQDQKQTNAPGGCSEWRTQEVQAEAVRLMCELHGDFVKPRMKQNKTGGDFGERQELTVFWKKAYDSRP